MNAIDFLTKEHDKVRKIFSEIDESSPREDTQEKFDALCHDLIRHETMEHQVWYPYLKNNEKVHTVIEHLLSEEEHASKVIKSFDAVKTQAEWEKKFLKFKDEVEHHASEEEQKLFPKVKDLLDENELQKIGKEMLEYKQTYENKSKSL